MLRPLAVALFSALLAACSHGASESPPIPPVQGGGGPPPSSSPTPIASPTGAPTTHPTVAPTTTPTARPTVAPTMTPTPVASSTPFNPSNVHITEHRVAVTPLYVAAGPDRAAYFGFGANGTGSNLYRYAAGAFVQTLPAPAPAGYTPGGGVYGIAVSGSGRVFWLSSYFDASLSLFVDVECGGSGGTATLCEPTIDEPTSMLVDRSGTFWIAGLTVNGGGEIATSSHASTSFDTQAVMQILNGPQQAVWGVLADYSRNPTLYSVAEFSVSGSSIGIVHDFTLPQGDSIASMTVGGDGRFWFTDSVRNAIGRIDTSGSVREFALHAANALAPPWFGQWQIATACDGAVWFAEPGPNKIGRIDAKGAIDEFTLRTAGAGPAAVASTEAPHHKCTPPELWVGEQHANALAAVAF